MVRVALNLKGAAHARCCRTLLARQPLLSLSILLLAAGGLLGASARVEISTKAPEVAVVGAGVGGAFAAHFLRELLGPKVDLSVIEEDKVGGRVAEIVYGNQTIEMGASVVYNDNFYVVNATSRLGLERQQLGEDGPSLVSLWDGKNFVFTESTSTPVTLWRAWCRWGLAPLNFKSIPKAFFEQFKAIYRLQDQGVSFTSPDEMLRAMSEQCFEATQKHYSDYVSASLGASTAASRYESEFLEAVNRNNYGQTNSQMNAFAGLVSALAATDGDHLFQIKGGNSALCRSLLMEAGVTKVTGRVTAIERLASGRYSISAASSDGEALQLGPYDGVVISAPLEQAKIRLIGATVPPSRTYQHTHTTLVAGALNPMYFGVETLPGSLAHILPTKSCQDPFNTISLKGSIPHPSGGGHNVTIHKLFSPERLTAAQLSDMFVAGFEVVAQKNWAAYPRFDPPEKFQPFQLAPGLAYNNAIENAASAIEMCAIAARNSALLLQKHLKSFTGPQRLARQHAMPKGTRLTANIGLEPKLELR